MLSNILRIVGIIAGIVVIAAVVVWMYEVNQGRALGFVPQQPESYQVQQQFQEPQTVVVEKEYCPQPQAVVVEAPRPASCCQSNSQSSTVTVENTLPQPKVVVVNNTSGVAVTPVIRHFTGTRYVNYQSHNTESFNTAPFRNTTTTNVQYLTVANENARPDYCSCPGGRTRITSSYRRPWGHICPNTGRQVVYRWWSYNRWNYHNSWTGRRI